MWWGWEHRIGLLLLQSSEPLPVNIDRWSSEERGEFLWFHWLCKIKYVKIYYAINNLDFMLLLQDIVTKDLPGSCCLFTWFVIFLSLLCVVAWSTLLSCNGFGLLWLLWLNRVRVYSFKMLIQNKRLLGASLVSLFNVNFNVTLVACTTFFLSYSPK